MGPSAQERQLQRPALGLRELIQSAGTGRCQFIALHRLSAVDLHFQGRHLLLINGVMGTATRPGAQPIYGQPLAIITIHAIGEDRSESYSCARRQIWTNASCMASCASIWLASTRMSSE